MEKLVEDGKERNEKREKHTCKHSSQAFFYLVLFLRIATPTTTVPKLMRPFILLHVFPFSGLSSCVSINHSVKSVLHSLLSSANSVVETYLQSLKPLATLSSVPWIGTAIPTTAVFLLKC